MQLKRMTLLAVAAVGLVALSAQAADRPTAEKGLTEVYRRIADTILASKESEAAVVRAILAAERDAALAALEAAGGKGSAEHLRAAATHLGHFATEGGPAIEPIRNRLLAGGHHHNADDTGPNAVYDEGYVVLTKKLKQEALELAKRASKLAESGKDDAKEVGSIRADLTALAARALATK